MKHESANNESKITEPLAEGQLDQETLSAQDKDFLGQIWGEKNGRPIITTEPPYCLIVALESPEYRTDAIVISILDTLEAADPKLTFQWSKQWGQARIALAPDDIGWGFVEVDSDQSKKYSPVFTTETFPASEVMIAADEPPVDPIRIVINSDKMVSMEGAVLQIERMVDEAVWTMCQSIVKNEQIGNESAYAQAIDIIKLRGMVVQYASAASILDAKRRHPEVPVRLYGDVHKQQTIPPVIGAIVVRAEIEIDSVLPQGFASETGPSIPECLCQKLPPSGEQEKTGPTAVLLSITAGKRLHLGHMMHLAKAKSYGQSAGTEYSLNIEFNDTGPRLDAMLKAACNDTGRTEAEIVASINNGEYALATIEHWYTLRDRNVNGMYTVPRRKPLLYMVSQADEIAQSVERILPDIDIRIKPSSHISLQHVLAHSDGAWRGTGSERLAGRVLCKRGGPTALLSRLGWIDETAQANRAAQLLYVDAAMAEATRIASTFVENNIIAVSGAAVGFDFAIHSGSNATEELTATTISDWYQRYVSDDLGQLPVDLEYMMALNPVCSPLASNEAFFNYKDLDSFKLQLQKSRATRLQLFDMFTAESNIELLEQDGIVFKSQVDKATKTAVTKILRSAAAKPERDNVYHVHTAETKLSVTENHSTIKALRDEYNLSGMTVTPQLLSSLINAFRSDKLASSSTTLQVLANQGYHTDTEVESALDKMIRNDLSLVFHLTARQVHIRNCLEVHRTVTALGPRYHNGLKYIAARLRGHIS